MDDKFFLSNIINVYYDKNYDYKNLYRFVGMPEFCSLFNNKEWGFTNPSTWKPTDQFENYFEDWWVSKEKLIMWLKIYKETMEVAYQKVGLEAESTWMLSSVVFW